jgi:hypothetical protein
MTLPKRERVGWPLHRGRLMFCHPLQMAASGLAELLFRSFVKCRVLYHQADFGSAVAEPAQKGEQT